MGAGMLNWFRGQPEPVIEFLCSPADNGLIPPPIRAALSMPEWFRALRGLDVDEEGLRALTAKRCVPFVDAMLAGWVLPLCEDVTIEISEGGTKMTAPMGRRLMVSEHAQFQLADNPYHPRKPAKLHNYWIIKTPPGWSCLFVPPMNRPNPVLELFSGIVDTDVYHSLINFPFIPICGDGRVVLERGMPIAQVIPFQRRAWALEGKARCATVAEMITSNHLAGVVNSTMDHYRHMKARNRKGD
jgi:hypothetical protein